MNVQEDYQALLSDLIKKQVVMLGPGVALSRARKVGALSIADSGEVTAITGDCQKALRELVSEYMELSGQIAQTTLSSLLEKYPNIKQAQSGG